jgi:ElaB/YqjD/DUF883 family membrane-anchored ribosome-binding protein
MNLFGSPKITRNKQSDVFSNHIVEDIGKKFNFMNEPEINNVDNIINNMVIFLKNKLELIKVFPESNTNQFSILKGEQLDNVKILISLGLIEINSKNQDDKRNHFNLDQLENASFKKDASASLFIQYISEYIQKLEELKNFSLGDKSSTEFSLSKDNSVSNTTYQLKLDQTMTFFINKNKFLIFDIYLNHYVQYMYLLFAINVFKNAKSILEINASRQKKDIMLGKVLELSQVYNDLQTKDDKKNTDSLKQQLSILIEQFESIPNIESDNKKSGGGQEKCKGGSYDSNISTMADNVINELFIKHKHFLNVFRKTRDSLPEYFNTINSLIIEKMTELKNLKTGITVLTAKEYEIVSKADKEMLEFFKKNDLQLDYDIKNNQSLKETIDNRLKQISDDIDSQLKATISQSKNLYKETDNIINDQPAIPSQVFGGFVRGSTLFPKNNYKNKN